MAEIVQDTCDGLLVGSLDNIVESQDGSLSHITFGLSLIEFAEIGEAHLRLIFRRHL